MKGGESMKGEEDGGESYSGRHSFGGESILEGDESNDFLGLDFLILWESSAVFEYHCRGHRVARGFGHVGQDSFQFPGARELDRLLLAGWEDSRFGQSWSAHQATTEQQDGQPGQWTAGWTTESMDKLASGRGKFVLLC
jgi:hypothetical protein